MKNPIQQYGDDVTPKQVVSGLVKFYATLLFYLPLLIVSKKARNDAAATSRKFAAQIARKRAKLEQDRGG